MVLDAEQGFREHSLDLVVSVADCHVSIVMIWHLKYRHKSRMLDRFGVGSQLMAHNHSRICVRYVAPPRVKFFQMEFLWYSLWW